MALPFVRDSSSLVWAGQGECVYVCGGVSSCIIFCPEHCKGWNHSWQTWLLPSFLPLIRWNKWTCAAAVTRYLKTNRVAKQLVSKPRLISLLGTSYYRAKQKMSVWVLRWEYVIPIWFGLVQDRSVSVTLITPRTCLGRDRLLFSLRCCTWFVLAGEGLSVSYAQPSSCAGDSKATSTGLQSQFSNSIRRQCLLALTLPCLTGVVG